MERKGGCCLAPMYGAAAGQEAWQMGKIMLKFRPIAPKPAAMAAPAPTPTPAPLAAVGAAGKGKRKPAAGGGGRRGRKPKKAATTVVVVTAATQKVDVQDQGEKQKDSPPSSSPSTSSSGMTSSTPPLEKEGLSAVAPPTAADLQAPAHDVGRHAAAPHQALRPVASSSVTVESVTGAWRDGEAPPSATACCSQDDAPAFVTDQWGRVAWTNLAFNRAVLSASDAAAGVALAAKDGAAVPAWGTCAGFTCRVRVAYACPRRGSLVAPCDVWRIDAGSYLWRLDLQATLTLSLGGLM